MKAQRMTQTYKKPSSKLTRGLQGSELEAFERSYQNAHTVLDRISEVLQKEMTSLIKEEDAPERFENPNWAYYQAYMNGQRKAVRDLINLLDKGRP